MDAGHNNPPELVELAADVAKGISQWMADNPVIETAEVAKDAKLQIDRAKLCIQDLDNEKTNRTRPLSERINKIRSEYLKPTVHMEAILNELKYRLQLFVYKEEERRQQEAKTLAEKAEQARLAALAAEQKEKEKLDDAAHGEVGIDVGAAMAEADDAFEAYAQAERDRLRAESSLHVKITGGLSRAIGLRNKKTLAVAGTMQAICAIEEMGLTKDIEIAILKSARAYQKVHRKLPNGITETVEKSL